LDLSYRICLFNSAVTPDFSHAADLPSFYGAISTPVDAERLFWEDTTCSDPEASAGMRSLTDRFYVSEGVRAPAQAESMFEEFLQLIER
jgi:hypothetical protein